MARTSGSASPTASPKTAKPAKSTVRAKASAARAKAKAKKLARTGNGKGRRTPAQLVRQALVFELSVLEGKTVRAIAAQLEIAQDTVISDMRAEEALRAAELGAQRESEKTRQLALVNDLYAKSMAIRDEKGTGALGAAAKAVEMRAKLLGLDAPTKTDDALQALVDALKPK